ncbi:hypothetical protein HK405_008713, partial [Cladochytrium tenue]
MLAFRVGTTGIAPAATLSPERAVAACLAALDAAAAGRAARESPQPPSPRPRPLAAIVLASADLALANGGGRDALLSLPRRLRAAGHPLLPPALPAVGAIVAPGPASHRAPALSVALLADLAPPSSAATDTAAAEVRAFAAPPPPPLAAGLSARRKAVGRWPELGAAGRLAVERPRTPSLASAAAFDPAAADAVRRLRDAGIRLDAGSDDAAAAGVLDADGVAAAAYTLPELDGLELRGGDLVLSFTDSEPELLARALHSRFPLATKLGLVAAPTPFTTGLECTLFTADGGVVGGGAVGLAVRRSPAAAAAPRWRVQLEFHGLRSLGPPAVITQCRGNVILELDSGAAAGILLAQTRAESRTPRPDGGSGAPVAPMHAAVWPSGSSDGDARVYRVLGGDPARGSVALEMAAPLTPGMHVQ